MMASDGEIELYLLRHGLTDDNASGTIQGHQPTPLNADGLAQAALLATRFGPGAIALDALVSSDLLRAAQTARAVAGAAGVPIVWSEAWRERGLGPWEGRRVGEVGIWQASSGEVELPGAEPWPDFAERVAAALEALPERFPDARRIAVVSHGGALRTVLRLLALGERLLAYGEPAPAVATIANCGILRLSCRPGRPPRFAVRAVNDVAHLGLPTSADAG